MTTSSLPAIQRTSTPPINLESTTSVSSKTSSKASSLFQRFKAHLPTATQSNDKLLKTQVKNAVKTGLQEIQTWAAKENAEIVIPEASHIKKLCDRYVKLKTTDKKSKAPIYEIEGDYALIFSNGQGFLKLMQIAEGGEHLVFLGIDLQTGKSIVILEKSELTCADFANKAFKPELFSQLRSLSEKPSSPFVRLIDLINIEHKEGGIERQFVVEHWCKGGNLFDHLTHSPSLTSEQKKKFIQNVFEAPLLLSKKGLFHKDLKPENFFIDGDKIVLGDLDAIQDEVPQTSAYAAPECFTTEAFDEKSAVWSLGHVIFFILFEKPAAIYQALNSIWQDLSDEQKEVFVSSMTLDSCSTLLPWEQNSEQLNGKGGLALVAGMMRADPNKRWTFEQAFSFFESIALEDLNNPHEKAVMMAAEIELLSPSSEDDKAPSSSDQSPQGGSAHISEGEEGTSQGSLSDEN